MNEEQLTEWIKGKSLLQIKQKIEDIKCMYDGAVARAYWSKYYGQDDLTIMWNERMPVYYNAVKFLGGYNI